MEYITIKRARFAGISGDLNLPYGTSVYCEDGFICHNGELICYDHSQNAYDYFARNDDSEGLRRGKITQAICKTLEKRDIGYQNRWNKIWADSRCQKYKRDDHLDFWLWSFDFYNAEIADLQYIATLIGAKV